MDHSLSSKNKNIFSTAVILVVVIFLTGWILGIRGPVLIANDRCYQFLGCNAGFFGYDAALHFVSGIMDVMLLVWLMRRYAKFSLFQERFWKNLLIMVALVAMISVFWEFGELCHDQFKMKVLHEDLIATNHLDQPSNNDTVGDMTFALIGGALTVCALNRLMRKREE